METLHHTSTRSKTRQIKRGDGDVALVDSWWRRCMRHMRRCIQRQVTSRQVMETLHHTSTHSNTRHIKSLHSHHVRNTVQQTLINPYCHLTSQCSKLLLTQCSKPLLTLIVIWHPGLRTHNRYKMCLHTQKVHNVSAHTEQVHNVSAHTEHLVVRPRC